MKCSDCQKDLSNRVSYLLKDGDVLCAPCFHSALTHRKDTKLKRNGKFNRVVVIDIKDGDIDILVHGQKVLHIGQVSDQDVINLWLYTEANIMTPMMDDPECKGELIISREVKHG